MNEEIDLTCPITRQIFLEPVITNTKITYEKTEINFWMRKHEHCPMTNQKITSFKPNLETKVKVSEYLKSNPEKKHEQYKKTIYPLIYKDIQSLITASIRGDIDSLKFIHENGVKWHSHTSCRLAHGGYLEALKYIVSTEIPQNTDNNGCPWHPHTCYYALLSGNLECFKYAYDTSLERFSQNPLNSHRMEDFPLKLMLHHCIKHKKLDFLKHIIDNTPSTYYCRWKILTMTVQHDYLEALVFLHQKRFPYNKLRLIFLSGNETREYVKNNMSWFV